MNDSCEPRIVAFLCNWCAYAAADLAGASRLPLPACVRTVRVMCSSRLDATLVVDAILRGADGIFIAGCHPGDCHYTDGNLHARRKVAQLRTVLAVNGLEETRVRLVWIAASEAPEFSRALTDFVTHVKTLGPSHWRTSHFT